MDLVNFYKRLNLGVIMELDIHSESTPTSLTTDIDLYINSKKITSYHSEFSYELKQGYFGLEMDANTMETVDSIEDNYYSFLRETLADVVGESDIVVSASVGSYESNDCLDINVIAYPRETFTQEELNCSYVLTDTYHYDIEISIPKLNVKNLTSNSLKTKILGQYHSANACINSMKYPLDRLLDLILDDIYGNI